MEFTLRLDFFCFPPSAPNNSPECPVQFISTDSINNEKHSATIQKNQQFKIIILELYKWGPQKLRRGHSIPPTFLLASPPLLGSPYSLPFIVFLLFLILPLLFFPLSSLSSSSLSEAKSPLPLAGPAYPAAASSQATMSGRNIPFLACPLGSSSNSFSHGLLPSLLTCSTTAFAVSE